VDNQPSRRAHGLAAIREEYTREGLTEDDLPAEPLDLLLVWLEEAVESGLYDPTAMVLSTVAATGRPSSRMVLCKGLSRAGLDFFTNYSSRKAEELAGQTHCALVFPWHALQRQVRVDGTATRLADADNDAYFAQRPRESQLGAWASPQSRVVESRAQLDRRYAEAAERFGTGPVPRPPYWGGFRVRPETVEFWQGRRSRMHDRFRYQLMPTRPDRPWDVRRLAP
jgi:pyridoxamine 5'-phosphate oxidase